MVQWKMANYLKDNDPIGDTPMFHEKKHDYGRKGRMIMKHMEKQWCFVSYHYIDPWCSFDLISYIAYIFPGSNGRNSLYLRLMFGML